MKKLFIFLLCIFMFSGCTHKNNSAPPVPDLNFCGDISVTYKNYTLECEIDNKIASGCVITVKKPALISGLSMTVKDGTCTFYMGDISYEVDPETMKKTEFATSLSEALKNVLNTTTYEKLENGYWKYTGQTQLGKFILLQDSESGYPVSLRIPDTDLHVKFSNMKSNVN